MWIMTTGGYVSIVAKGGPGVLMVRARDLESLKSYCTGAGIDFRAIVTGVGTDYPHRVYSNRHELEKFLLAEVEYVQYKNFKDEAKLVRGKKFADFLQRVWTASLSIEDVEFEKWKFPFADSEYDWSEEIDQKHLTIKKNLGYDGSKNGGKHRRRKGHRK